MDKWQVRPYIRPTGYPAVSGGDGVIRLSLGKLLVNLLQVVKRTNTQLITLTNGVVDRPWVFGSWVRSPPSTIMNFSDFPMSNLKNTLPGIPRELNVLDN